MTKTPGMRQYAIEQTSNLLGRLVFQIHHATRSHDAEAIHDLRVSIRRFNQSGRAFAQFFPQGQVKRIRRRLREIMNAAAVVRDRDTALELCTQLGVPEDAPLFRALAGERKEAEHGLRARLIRFEARGRSSRWRVRLGL